jgi:hypothetical protein
MGTPEAGPFVERPGNVPKLPPGATPPVDDAPSAEVARYVSFTADLVRHGLGLTGND